MIHHLAIFALAIQAPDCTLVPGWTPHDKARTYVRETLFEYMNGNAEGYLAYGFVRMQGVTCRKGDVTLIIDVSEMTDLESAWGIFTTNRDPDGKVEAIGTAGQVLARRATFAKDRYYVEMSAEAEADHTATLRAFASALESRIQGRTELPEELGWFPSDGLAGVRFVPQSVLGLRLLARGYVAEYASGKAFVVREASSEAAAALVQKLRERFAPVEATTVAQEALLATDRYLGRLCIFRKGRYVAGSTGDGATALAERLAAKIP